MKNNLEKIRHSLAHLMAMAVLEKFPKAKLGIGPIIENGFYYDFDKIKISDADILEMEKRMRELIKKDLKFQKEIISFAEAKKLFANQPYKLELIKELQKSKKPITIYKTFEGLSKTQNLKPKTLFVDLCAGPHINSTKEINPDSFKLTKIAGAYWKGSEKNPMLTRIYGVAFEIKKELDDYLKMMEEAEKRDHRKLGKDLDLFVFSDIVGKGLPLWTEKGAIIKRELERFIIDEEIKRGYKHVCTPDIAKVDLYKKSGHYPYYKDSMYAPMKVDEEELILRPMTCPHHFELYLSKPRSYKELPMRIAELAKLYRYEQSGELTGLIRLRSFCLADAHIICKDSKQAGEEINMALDLIEYAASIFGFKIGENYSYRLSLGDRKNKEKYYKDDKAWNEAEGILRKILKNRESKFIEAKDEATFYGPKIDIQMKNARGKEDTVFTVQYDFVMPKRFKLNYIDEKGKEKESVVVHRSSIGAIERTIAFLLEYTAGKLPVWLSPIQTIIIPVSDKFNDYGKKMFQELKNNGIRAEIDDNNETLGKRIRNAELQKIPYILVVGDKEVQNQTINVRHYKRGQEGEVKIEKLIEKITNEVKNKTL
ncbi:MAG: threonine--tRNA ligase [Patescibacteria group bacterium]